MSDKPADPKEELMRAGLAAKAREMLQQQHSVEAERKEIREKYLKYVAEVWKIPDNCPVCDSTWWNIGELVEMPLRRVPAELLDPTLTPQVYLFVPVTCMYCSHTRFFNVSILDVRGTEEVKAVPPLRHPDEEQQ